MIGSHNTFTYANPKNWIFRLFKGIWKCQEYHWRLQCADFFDIRIVLNEDGTLKYLSHGIVDLKVTDFYDFLDWAKRKNKYFRVLIERQTEYKTTPFLTTLINNYEDCLVEIRVKKTWEVVYKNPNINLQLIDMTFVPFIAEKPWYKQPERWKYILDYPIKKWVKKNCRELTKEEIEDPSKVYLVDYINYY